MTTPEEQLRMEENIAKITVNPAVDGLKAALDASPIPRLVKLGLKGPLEVGPTALFYMRAVKDGTLTTYEAWRDGSADIISSGSVGGAIVLMFTATAVLLTAPVTLPLTLSFIAMSALIIAHDPGDVVQSWGEAIKSGIDSISDEIDAFFGDGNINKIEMESKGTSTSPEVHLDYNGSNLTLFAPSETITKDSLQDFAQHLNESELMNQFDIGNGTLLNVNDAGGTVAYKLGLDSDGDLVIDYVNGEKRIYIGTDAVDTLSFADAEFAVDASLASGNTLVNGSIHDIIADNIENIVGSAYNDDIIGSEGNNVIEGGDGSDEMSGFGGSDRFVFEYQSGAIDTITDFAIGVDTLDLSEFSGVNFGYDVVAGAAANVNFPATYNKVCAG